MKSNDKNWIRQLKTDSFGVFEPDSGTGTGRYVLTDLSDGDTLIIARYGSQFFCVLTLISALSHLQGYNFARHIGFSLNSSNKLAIFTLYLCKTPPKLQTTARPAYLKMAVTKYGSHLREIHIFTV